MGCDRSCESVVLSDSVIVLKKIKTGFLKQPWLRSLQMSQIDWLSFFATGHESVRWNERADQLTNLAIIEEEWTVDWANIISDCKRSWLGKRLHWRPESVSLSRMKRLENETWCGRTWTANQKLQKDDQVYSVTVCWRRYWWAVESTYGCARSQDDGPS